MPQERESLSCSMSHLLVLWQSIEVFSKINISKRQYSSYSASSKANFRLHSVPRKISACRILIFVVGLSASLMLWLVS